MKGYKEFLQEKEIRIRAEGFDPVWLPDFLYPFQKHLVQWSVRKGLAAIFADCGLGKTPIQLVWAENILRKHGGKILILAPLAVSRQTKREGDKFGIEVNITQDGKLKPGINITNYERIDRFSPDDLIGCVCDESSVTKNFDGKMRRKITDFTAQIKYRLLATATPAPNDFMELGTSSEILGAMGRNQMLAMFFTNRGDTTQEWQLKGHAKSRFWQWVATWARAIRMPSDLGFEDDGFVLPELRLEQHVLPAGRKTSGLFPKPAVTLDEQREEARLTLKERCGKVAELVSSNKGRPWLIWCHLNAEGNLLEKIIPEAVQVQGADKDDVKERRLNAFIDGTARVLVTKPKIAGFGLNLQHCSDVVYFPSHSHERYYQAIRRCWRFGQKRPVTCNLVSSEGESLVVSNMLRKERQSVEMYEGICRAINQAVKKGPETNGHVDAEVPEFLKRGID